jgi:hypothetical protein
MNATNLHFRCPHCQARIKAPVQLAGQNRACPGCHHPMRVPGGPLADSGPKLVLLEEDERLVLRPAVASATAQSRSTVRRP